MTVFLLPPPPPNFSGVNQIAGTGGYPYCKIVEPAGRELHRRLKNLAKGRTFSQDSIIELDSKTELQQQEEQAIAKYRKNIKGKNFLELTMYDQLGLEDYGFAVTDDQIRKAYHRALIEHHPDKTGKTENDPNYLALQKAFATLTDKQKKRAYDSQCNFDDWIPTGNETIRQNSSDNSGICFYELYGPIFLANGRFSEKQPVPQLGNDETDIDTVYAFYDFWHKFDSWRDFTFDAEHDVDSAERRDEKRWMAKKNEAEAKKKKKKEYARLSNLVDRAFANDPRIRRAKQAEKEAKETAKRLKQEAAERQRREAELAEKAAAAALCEKEAKEKAEALQAKFAKEKIKKATRKMRKLLRDIIDSAHEAKIENVIDTEDTDFLCEVLEYDQLKQLVEALGDTETINEKGLATVKAIVTAHRGEDFMKAKDDQKQYELELVRKARQEEDEMKRKKKVCIWSAEELSMLAKCTVKFPGGTRNRWQIIADYINNQLALSNPKSKEECIAKAQEQTEKLNQSRSGLPETAHQESTAWSAAQQAALEQALKDFPSTIQKNERWRKICNAVEGKSKKECIERFKYLRECVLSKKAKKEV